MTTLVNHGWSDNGQDAPADQASIRRRNLGLLLRHLRDGGGRSRAQLAAETGLSKATMSSLVADLVERGLTTEGEVRHEGVVGRPGLVVELAGHHICGIGVEINADYLSIIALDLTGAALVEETEAIDVPSMDPTDVLDAVAAFVGRTLVTLRSSGIQPMGICVATPGVIDSDAGIAVMATSFGWHDVPVVKHLSDRLGETDIRISIANDAKLGAVAEHSELGAPGADDLLYLSGDAGVGAGIISGGKLVHGATGFAGEVGHLPLASLSNACPCGRTGCWETVVGLNAFLADVAPAGDRVRDTRHPLEGRMIELNQRAEAGDPATRAALARLAGHLGLGISMLVDLLNPELVVLGGYFAYFDRHLLPAVREILDERDIYPFPLPTTIVHSTLGLTGAARGGARLTLDAVFDDPTLVPPDSRQPHSR